MKEITRLSLVRIVCRRSKVFLCFARNKEEKQQVLVEREEEKRDTKKRV